MMQYVNTPTSLYVENQRETRLKSKVFSLEIFLPPPRVIRQRGGVRGSGGVGVVYFLKEPTYQIWTY